MSSPSHTETDPARVHRTPIVIEDAPVDDSTLPALDPEAYELLDEIARGGMGRILRARDRLGRIVAVKQLLDPSPHHIALFEREARITARLQHPSIVSVIEAGVLPDGQRVYVMKLVPGRSLKQVLREVPPGTSPLRNLPIVIAIADALAYAHTQGVIHRDLKPSNVLIGEFGEVVVIDWGLAHDRLHVARGAAAPDGAPIDATVTARAMGTPAYMSPEAARSEPVDSRADVYAIGAILYEVLAGSAPYAGDGAQILDAVRRGLPVSIAERVPCTPSDLAAIVDKAMARERDARYPSAKELADELRRFATGQLVSAHAYSLGERFRRWVRRHRAPVAVASAAMLVIGISTTITVSRIIEERNLATDRAERLTLAGARLELDRDPAAALETLADLPPTSASWSAARVIAADAVARGIPRHARLAHPVDTVALVAARPRVVIRGDDVVEVVELGAPAPTVIARIGEPASAVALSTDGSTLAVLAGGRLRAWRVAHPERVLFDHAAPRIQPVLAISADGAVIAVAGSDVGLVAVGADGAERVHDAQARELVQLAVTREAVLALDTRGALTARSLAQPDAPVSRLDGDVPLHALAVGGELVAAAGQGELRLLGPHLEARRTLATGITATAISISPDGRGIAVAGDTGIAVFDGTGTRRRTIAARRRPRAIAIDDAGTVAVIERGELWWWSAGERAPIGLVRASTAVARAGDRVVIGSDDGAVWMLRAGELTRLGGHVAAVRAVAGAPDGSFAVTTGDDGAVRRWTFAGEPALLAVHHGPGLAIAVAPDGAVASGGVDRLVQLRRAGDAAREVVLGRHRGAIRGLAFSPDGYELLSIADDREAIVWSLDARRPARRLEHRAPVTAAAWLADGTLVTGTRDGEVAWWSRGATSSRVLATHRGAVRALATSGDRIASGGDDGAVGLGDASGLVLWPGHVDLVRGLAFAADGGSLASASEDGTARLWDPATGESRAIALGGWVANVVVGERAIVAVGATGAWTISDELPREREPLQRAVAALIEAAR